MKFSMLPQSVGLLKLMLNFLCTSNIQGWELCWRDFMEYSFNIVMLRDACERICFKLGMMLNTSKLYSLSPVWMTLVFTQGHRITGKLELVQWFCCKVVWGAGSGRRLRRSRGEGGGGGGGKKDRAGTDLCGAHNFHNAILCSDFLCLW